jgi:SAM-dependent methyltransferase
MNAHKTEVVLAFVPNSWLFVNNKLTRLAIKLVPLLQGAPAAVHPKHLVEAPAAHYGDVVKESDRVLDLGCGSGGHAMRLAPLVKEVVAVDYDPRELALGQARVRKAGYGNVRFEVRDITKSGLGDLGAFDVVVFLDVIEHLHDRVRVLRQIARVLAPSGRVVITAPHSETPYKKWRRRLGGFPYIDADHKIEYATEAELINEIEAGGLTVEKLERFGFDTPFPGFAALAGAFSPRIYKWLGDRRNRIGRRKPQWAVGFRVTATVGSRLARRTGT